jgi:hypothetical protein
VVQVSGVSHSLVRCSYYSTARREVEAQNRSKNRSKNATMAGVLTQRPTFGRGWKIAHVSARCSQRFLSPGSSKACYTGSVRKRPVRCKEYRMEITLTPEIEAALAEQARRQGVSPEQLALESLRQRFVVPRQNTSGTSSHGTLADFLGASIGVLHSREYVPGGARLSEAKSTAFTESLLKKRQQGKL